MVGTGCLWAYELLRERGFHVDQIVEEGAPEPVVEQQTPMPHTEVAYGSTVTIYCG